MYFVELSQRSQKYLDKLDKHVRERIESRLKNLESKPVPKDSKFTGRVGGDKVFRYRIGDYRALYKIKEDEKYIIAKTARVGWREFEN